MLSYEVVAMTLERSERIGYFADYYLRHGAQRVSLYYDGVVPPCELGEGAEVVSCDDGFWRFAAGGRPAGVEDRQRAVYKVAYQRCRADWLLVVDIDEFAVGFDAVGRAAAQAGEAVTAIRIPSAEAVFGSQDDPDLDFGARYFRIPQGRVMAQLAPRVLYPGHGRYFIRGLLGHAIGKQFVRAGVPGLAPDIHSVMIHGTPQMPLQLAAYRPEGGVFLCHFDAISRAQWKEKWRRRLRNLDALEMGAKREGQLALYAQAEAQGEAQVDRLFSRLYTFSPAQFELVARLGYAFRFEGFRRPAAGPADEAELVPTVPAQLEGVGP